MDHSTPAVLCLVTGAQCFPPKRSERNTTNKALLKLFLAGDDRQQPVLGKGRVGDGQTPLSTCIQCGECSYQKKKEGRKYPEDAVGQM